MKNNTYIKLTSGITALALTCSLGLNGCVITSNDRFNISEGSKGEFIVSDNDYIDNIGIKNIYVIEVLNKITKEKQIYITTKRLVKDNKAATSDYLTYIDIFNNVIIYSTENEETKHSLELIEETPLFDYLLAYELVKSKYYYKDMQEIYNIIKENYEIQNANSLSKKLIINNQRI